MSGRRWLNSDISLFAIYQDGWPYADKGGEWEGCPCYISCDASIRDIKWSRINEPQSCQYCGSIMEGGKCPQCGNRAALSGGHSLGRAQVTLEGYLPAGAFIFDVPKGAIFDLTHIEYGDRCRYDARQVAMRIVVCDGAVKRWMPNLTALRPDEEEFWTLFITLDCDIELYPDGMEAEE